MNGRRGSRCSSLVVACAVLVTALSTTVAGTVAVAGDVRDGTSAGTPFYSTAFTKTPSAAEMAAVGRRLFFDRALSASGRTACATCHAPGRAFGPPNAAPVQLGGRDGRRAGVRAVPSLMYTQNIPPFTEHYADDEDDDSIDQGAAGGRSWDGRAETAHEQALLPLFSPFEMANTGIGRIVWTVRRAAYAPLFRRAFGDTVFADEALALKGVLMALETYQQTPVEFYPYTSKYDAWLRGLATLTKVEERGLNVFNDPARGNCARCHPSAIKAGAFPQFTDFGYAAVGAPRNPAIAANADPHYHDLGLCGPLRVDLTDRKEYCGMFRTPSLRNVARRRVFFHNGVVRDLRDAVRFYAERDTHPERWYPRVGGTVNKFDDLPAQFRGNVDVQAPFDRKPGDAPALDDSDIDAVVAFLRTLTDGYAVP